MPNTITKNQKTLWEKKIEGLQEVIDQNNKQKEKELDDKVKKLEKKVKKQDKKLEQHKHDLELNNQFTKMTMSHEKELSQANKENIHQQINHVQELGKQDNLAMKQDFKQSKKQVQQAISALQDQGEKREVRFTNQITAPKQSKPTTVVVSAGWIWVWDWISIWPL